MQKLEEIKEKIISNYKKIEKQLNSEKSDLIISSRLKALEIFEKTGIPDKNNENYKYTDLEKIFLKDYEILKTPDDSSIDISELFKCDVPELDTYIILTINGFFYKKNILNFPDGIIVESFAEASKKYAEIFNKYYNKLAQESEDSFINLNTLFARDGIFIYIPDNVVLNKPIQIINISYSLINLNIYRRNLIIAGKNSNCNIIVCDHTLTRNSFLTNVITELYANENSIVHYSRLQNENNVSSQISSLLIEQKKNSNVKSSVLSLHGGFIRNNFLIKLIDTGANSDISGLYIGDYQQHVSNYTNVMHMALNCNSSQLFKNILFSESSSAFNGKIYVAPGAQKTVAYQKNNNILLSDKAKAYSKPHLEIYADDVKCSHGATTGRIDEEALFYLRSRGITIAEARHLLIFAYGEEIIKNIEPISLRDRLQILFEKRLRGELNVCDECIIHCA